MAIRIAGVGGLLLCSAFALVSCSTPKPVRPVLVAPQHFEFSDVSARDVVLPWIGCQWTYDGPEPVTFEVWASTNLVDWVLATNTVERVALFPPKSMEFYRVRTRDEIGQVSDWAPVPAR